MYMCIFQTFVNSQGKYCPTLHPHQQQRNGNYVCAHVSIILYLFITLFVIPVKNSPDLKKGDNIQF